MPVKEYYFVILKKGPIWTAEKSDRLDKLMEGHLAHLANMQELGYALVSGPATDHQDENMRGFSIYHIDKVGTLAQLKELVNQDPMFQVGHLVADYLTWFIRDDVQL